jgi:hypothetical protein
MAGNVGSGLDLLGAAGITASVTNSTITGTDGYGIVVDGGGALLTVIGTTISDNAASGLIMTADAGISVGSSVFAGNAEGCALEMPLTDAGFNVESGNSCGFGSASVTGVGDAAIGLGRWRRHPHRPAAAHLHRRVGAGPGQRDLHDHPDRPGSQGPGPAPSRDGFGHHRPRLPQQRRSRSHPGPLTCRESDSVD